MTHFRKMPYVCKILFSVSRVEWLCDNRNQNSKNSAIRLGFVYETLFHKECIIKNEVIDGPYYSMIDKDWPLVKHAFEEWLDPGNFDENGIQRSKLVDIRKRLEESQNGSFEKSMHMQTPPYSITFMIFLPVPADFLVCYHYCSFAQIKV